MTKPAEEMPARKPDASSEDVVALKNQITVILPTYNEEEAVDTVIGEVRRAGYQNIIVVDGYSNDRTVEVAKSKGIEVVMQAGTGKAGGLRTAFGKVRTPFVVVMDADGSYDPKDIDRFLPLMGEFDFVKGTRKANGSMSSLHRLGNYIITRSFNVLFGSSVADVCSGLYMLSSKRAKELSFEKHPLTVEQEIAAEMLLSAKPIGNVPVSYGRRIGGKSKTNTWRQGFRDLITNFDLARTHNPVLLFSFVASLVLIPAFGLLFYASFLLLFLHQYHGGYFLGSLVLLVLGAQGFTVATIAAMLRRIERKLNSFSR